MKILQPNPNGLTGISRFLLLMAGICLIVSIFVPIWRIELDAPQYPEGLMLQIFAYKLGGNVDIINGLNHYIGMKTLHAEEFIEFTVLPYIIGFYALFSIIAAWMKSKKVLYTLFSLFVLFGIVAMYDFWRWEYEYGHNLDPNAAIIVPGMAYQPPLIGFKQLLNFGAYSIPDKGGWLFICSGLLMLIAVFIEFKINVSKAIKFSVVVSAISLLTSCAPNEPVPVKVNAEDCAYCMMTISDIRFASELITDKGRVYKFDDIKCMVGYANENKLKTSARFYVCDYNGDGSFIQADQAYYVHGEQLKSPMRGNVAAFTSEQTARPTMEQKQASPIDWNNLFNN